MARQAPDEGLSLVHFADEGRATIDRLALVPHPEGGWYRETWRAAAEPGMRPGASAILFLLERGQFSHWHTVDAEEAWLWHAGAPIELRIAPGDAGPITTHRLGGDVLSGEKQQAIVPAGHWQAAEARDGWALASCVVVPAFRFEGFTLAPEGWEPG